MQPGDTYPTRPFDSFHYADRAVPLLLPSILRPSVTVVVVNPFSGLSADDDDDDEESPPVRCASCGR